MDVEVLLLRWKIQRDTEFVIADVRGGFDVRLLCNGTVMRARRFKLPRPAFDAARAWRRQLIKSQKTASH